MGIHEKDIMDRKQIEGASAKNMDKKDWRTPRMEKLDVKVLTQASMSGDDDLAGFS